MEFANADQQNTLDKYISGEKVALDELRKVWRESTQCINKFGESTIYFDLLKKIRNINLNLPIDKKIRVLGGDPPINWKSICSLEEYHKIISNRDKFAAELAIEYGIARSMKVLMIYSEYHFTKINDKSRIENPTITNYINEKYPNTMKVIAVLDPERFQLSEKTTNWPLYSALDLNTNEIGNLPAENYFTKIFNKDGRMILFAGNKIKELFDAFLYIGQSEGWKKVDLPKAVFSVKELNELNRRKKILQVKF